VVTKRLWHKFIGSQQREDERSCFSDDNTFLIPANLASIKNYQAVMLFWCKHNSATDSMTFPVLEFI